MSSRRKKTGDYGEALAESYLLGQGYELVQRGWRCPVGEVDLIALQGEILVFVEVRTRRGSRLGTPEESVTANKQAKLIELAYTYLQESGLPEPVWRIDVIAIELDRQNNVKRLNHIKSAVGE